MEGNNKDMPVWVVNPSGLVSAVTPEAARQLLAKPYWRTAREDEIPVVPKFKQYPEDLELTEKGVQRRARMQAAAEEKARRAEAKAEVDAEKEKVVTLEERTEKAIADSQKLSVKKKSIADKMAEGELLTPEEYRQLEWFDLRSYASSHSIKYVSKKKAEILKELDKIHGKK